MDKVREFVLFVFLPFSVVNEIMDFLFSFCSSVNSVVRENIFFAFFRSTLGRQLTARTHRQLFDLLLHLEEIQMDVAIRHYDMEQAPMETVSGKPHLLSLKVRSQSMFPFVKNKTKTEPIS